MAEHWRIQRYKTDDDNDVLILTVIPDSRYQQEKRGDPSAKVKKTFAVCDNIPLEWISDFLTRMGFEGADRPQDLVGRSVLADISRNAAGWQASNLHKFEEDDKWVRAFQSSTNLHVHTQLLDLYDVDYEWDPEYKCPSCNNTGRVQITEMQAQMLESKRMAVDECLDWTCRNYRFRRTFTAYKDAPFLNPPPDQMLKDLKGNVIFSCPTTVFHRYIQLFCIGCFHYKPSSIIRVMSFINQQIMAPDLNERVTYAALNGYPWVGLYVDTSQHMKAVAAHLPEIMRERSLADNALHTWVNIPSYKSSPHRNTDIDELIDTGVYRLF